MKKTNVLYWIFTGLAALLMLFSAIPDALNTPDAQKFMSGMLHYPTYIAPFLGVAKILGVIAILVPGYPRIKEWAYAGLVFDLAGAVYSGIAAAGKFDPKMLFMLIWILPVVLSYVYYHKRLNASAGAQEIKGNYKMA
jgi:hypothetical protein